jgi:hypothetical protein
MLTINNPKTFDWENMPLSDCLEGNAADAYFTLKIFDLIYQTTGNGDGNYLRRINYASTTDVRRNGA